MEADNVASAALKRYALSSPWPYYLVALAAAWALLIRHDLAHHAMPHTNAPLTTLSMWALMTTAMMAPTAVPVMTSLRAVLSSSSYRPWWAFIGAYLLVWMAFAGGATAMQLALVRLEVLGHNGATSYIASATLLGLAGAYQFSSLKRKCLTECVNPMTFFFKHWRDGVLGGARMGMRHGLACLGCCWALMLLAFVGGLNNLWFMVLGAAIMTIEKLPALSRWVTAPIGVALLGAAVVVLAVGHSPDEARPSHQSISIDRKESHERLEA